MSPCYFSWWSFLLKWFTKWISPFPSDNVSTCPLPFDRQLNFCSHLANIETRESRQMWPSSDTAWDYFGSTIFKVITGQVQGYRHRGITGNCMYIGVAKERVGDTSRPLLDGLRNANRRVFIRWMFCRCLTKCATFTFKHRSFDIYIYKRTISTSFRFTHLYQY